MIIIMANYDKVSKIIILNLKMLSIILSGVSEIIIKTLKLIII